MTVKKKKLLKDIIFCKSKKTVLVYLCYRQALFMSLFFEQQC